MRTAAVQHKKLMKRINYANGGTQERKFNFLKNILNGKISVSTREKTQNCT